MVGFLWKPEAALQISEGREQVMKSDWGSSVHLACAGLNAAIGVNITHVPYRGSSLAEIAQ